MLSINKTTIGRSEDLVVSVSDADGLGYVLIMVETSQSTEVAYANGAGSRYTVGTSAITNGTSYSILRHGGWANSSLVVRVAFHDSLGNLEETSWEVTITDLAEVTLDPETQPSRDLVIGLAIDEDGDLLLDGGINLTRGLDGVGQYIRTKLNTRLGEFFADESIGIPWFQEVLRKSPNIPLIREYLRRRMLTAPYVTDITRLELTFDRTSRHLAVDWAVRAEFGVVDGSVTL